jgi:hypothetical protein
MAAALGCPPIREPSNSALPWMRKANVLENWQARPQADCDFVHPDRGIPDAA